MKREKADILRRLGPNWFQVNRFGEAFLVKRPYARHSDLIY